MSFSKMAEELIILSKEITKNLKVNRYYLYHFQDYDKILKILNQLKELPVTTSDLKVRIHIFKQKCFIIRIQKLVLS